MRTREVGEIALGHRRILSTPFVKQALYFGGNADFFFRAAEYRNDVSSLQNYNGS
jgi:hypothetical protein